MPSVKIKRGDTKRIIRDTLRYNGNGIDLTLASSVHLVFKNNTTSSVVTRDATTIDNAGNVTYQLVADDVAVSGDFFLEWHVNYSDGKTLVIPQDSYMQLLIMDDLR